MLQFLQYMYINHLVSATTKLTYTYAIIWKLIFTAPSLTMATASLTTTPSALTMAPPQSTPHPTSGGSLFPFSSSSCGPLMLAGACMWR